MTLAQARALLRTLIGARDTSGSHTDAILLPILNLAQRVTWRWLAVGNVQLCATEETFSYTAGASSVNLYQPAPGGKTTYPVESILGLLRTPNAGAPSASNVPVALNPVNAMDIEQFAGSIANPESDYVWATLGLNALALRPIPAIAVPLIIRYVPTPADMANDTDSIFGGQLLPAHDCVVFQAAVYATSRLRESNAEFKAMLAEAQLAATANLRQKQIPMGPRNAWGEQNR